MMERVFALTKYQDFCAPKAGVSRETWPPMSARHVFTGETNQACDEVCFNKGKGTIEVFFYMYLMKDLCSLIFCFPKGNDL